MWPDELFGIDPNEFNLDDIFGSPSDGFDDVDYTDLDLGELPENGPPLIEEGLTPDYSWTPGDPTGGFNIEDIFDSGGPSFLQSILKALGLKQPGGGGGLTDSILPILSLLGLLGTSINNNNKTKEAGEKIANAAKESNAKADELISGARKNFSPYITTGQGALSQLPGLANAPGLGAKWGSPVAGIKMPPMKGSMTLSELTTR